MNLEVLVLSDSSAEETIHVAFTDKTDHIEIWTLALMDISGH